MSQISTPKKLHIDAIHQNNQTKYSPNDYISNIKICPKIAA